MLEFLTRWLKARAGAAPVLVKFAGDADYSKRVMIAVDETGVVLQGGPRGQAFPWGTILWIQPSE